MASKNRNSGLLYLALFLIPWLVFGGSAMREFAYADDVFLSELNHNDPMRCFDEIAGSGRPICSLLMIWSYDTLHHVKDFYWLRLIGIAGLGILGASTFYILGQFKWPLVSRFAAAMGLMLLPTAQVFVAWSSIFSYPYILALTALAFLLGEQLWMRPLKQPIARLTLVFLAIIVTAHIYQPCCFIYLAIFVARFCQRLRLPWQRNLLWILHHAILFTVGMALAYIYMEVLLAYWDISKVGRMAWRSNPIEAIHVLLTTFWPYASNFFVLRDMWGQGKYFFWGWYLIVNALICFSIWWRSRKVGLFKQAMALGVFLLNIPATVLLFLVIDSDYCGYRMIYAPAALAWLCFIWSIQSLPFHRLIRLSIGTLACATLTVTAWWHANYYMSIPSEKEWQLVRDQVASNWPQDDPFVEVLIVIPKINQTYSPVIATQEFGMLHMYPEYGARGMLWNAIRTATGKSPLLGADYRYTHQFPWDPEPDLSAFDVVIRLDEVPERTP